MNSELESSNLNGKSNMPDVESDLLDLFEDSADIVNDDTKPEEDLISIDDSESEPEEWENGTSMPVFTAETGTIGMIPMKAEAVENVTPVAIQATGIPAPRPLIWRPWLPYPVTARGVFDLALTLGRIDPARQQLGFFYEAQLKRECEMLVPHSIPSFYPQGILKALMLRRSNPGFFVCYAIDVVLTHYLNERNMEENYGQF